MERSVTVRPTPLLSGCMAIYAGFVTASCLATAPADGSTAGGRVCIAFAGALWLGAAVLAAWSLLCWVRADTDGVSWSIWGRRMSVPWEGVVDYWRGPVFRTAIQRHSDRFVLETKAGSVCILTSWYCGTKRFMDVVARRVGGGDGAYRGLRPGDAPVSFGYSERRLRFALWASRMWIAVVVLWYVCRVGASAARHDPVAHTETAIWLFTGLLMMPMLVCPWVWIRRSAAGLERAGERLTLGADGLLYEGAEATIKAAWSDVKRLTVVPSGVHEVETLRGTVSFDGSIDQCEFAMALIAVGAPHTGGWRLHDSVCGVREEPGGARIYAYRQPDVRGLLWFPGGMAFIGLVSAGIAVSGLGATTDVRPGLSVAVVCGIGWLYLWWRYATVSFRVDESGVTRMAREKRVSIAWGEVRSFRLCGPSYCRFGVLAGERSRIWFWVGLHEHEPLVQDILAHLPEGVPKVA